MESAVESQTNLEATNIATYRGEAITELPMDLYIPPDALKVILETFEGPLDLLLYLIKKHNLDILDIPISDITRQYVEYVELMHVLNLELAAEYLVMAAFLAEIKSRLLLPRPAEVEAEEVDPRAELVRRLQEYERFKKAAEDLDNIPRIERDLFVAKVDSSIIEITKPLPHLDIKELLLALAGVLKRAELNAKHQIQLEPLSIRERMTEILNKINADRFIQFTEFFAIEEGRIGVIVTFIAILELMRQTMIEIVQAEPFGPIHVRALA